jgi:hypothetical protein
MYFLINMPCYWHRHSSSKLYLEFFWCNKDAQSLIYVTFCKGNMEYNILYDVVDGATPDLYTYVDHNLFTSHARLRCTYFSYLACMLLFTTGISFGRAISGSLHRMQTFLTTGGIKGWVRARARLGRLADRKPLFCT